MDAIVIGAGLSGLAAAQRLADGGFTVTLIEARKRIGGRVLTLHRDECVIELGAEWVGNSGPVQSLLRDSGATVSEASGRYLRRTRDGFRKAHDPEDDAQPVLKRAMALPGPDRSFRQAIRALGLNDAEAERALHYVEGFHAADADHVGIRWLDDVEKTQSAAESAHRCDEGLDRVTASLSVAAAEWNVRLETVAYAIRWGPYGCEVDVKSPEGEATLRARAVVVTVPLPLLAELRLDPPLVDRDEALSLARMGGVAKVVLRFRDRFWQRRQELDALAFLFTPGTDFPTVWVGASEYPTLVMWSGGPRAMRLCTLDDDIVVARALGAAAFALDVETSEIERQLVSTHFHNWQRDPFARGAYTYMSVGGANAPDVLARPAGDAVFFAGEATAGGGYNATMEGAVLSGWRAAEEILAAHAGVSDKATT